jgi:serine protein kinase
MELRERLARFRDEEQRLAWEGTFVDYFEVVKSQPAVSDLAHARLHNMIMSAGVDTSEHAERKYKFFANDIFGLEKPLSQLVDYFNSAAKRLEVRKRILLLMGPVGGGKSTIVALLKRGMERFARSDAGAIYAIKGCPLPRKTRLRPPFAKMKGEIILHITV